MFFMWKTPVCLCAYLCYLSYGSTGFMVCPWNQWACSLGRWLHVYIYNMKVIFECLESCVMWQKFIWTFRNTHAYFVFVQFTSLDISDALTTRVQQKLPKWDSSLSSVNGVFFFPSQSCGKVINCLDIGGESSALIAGGGSDPVLRIWDPRKPGTLSPIFQFASHNSWISSCKWHPKSWFHLVSASYDGKVMLWDLRTAVCSYFTFVLCMYFNIWI